MAVRFCSCMEAELAAILLLVASVSSLMSPLPLSSAFLEIPALGYPTSQIKLSPPSSQSSNRFRLPHTLVPLHYDVELQPYLEKDSSGVYAFKGKSVAYFKCAHATNRILIHSLHLNYKLQGEFLVFLYAKNGATAPAINTTRLVVDTQNLEVGLKSNLEVGNEYSLHTEFNGELSDGKIGFYRSHYREDKQARIVAATQMQPTYARRAFPCFDEPAMKATFNVTLIHLPQYTALSNTPDISTTPKVIDGVTWHVTTFERTPKMSTYLLAFVVCDYDKVEETNNGVQTRIWARKEAIEKKQEAYAFSIAGRMLHFYEHFFNGSYILRKLDHIAVPDAEASAMENWGLIIYKEDKLLYDSSVSTIRDKETVVISISHELAHLWVGNLVTMKWWNDLWLSEGIVAYVQFLAADYIEPSWNMKEVAMYRFMCPVLDLDASPFSHPVSWKEEEYNTPEDIKSRFNPIIYWKGAAIIRMMAAFLTEEQFVKGLRSYLNANEYGSAVADDLWEHMQKAVDEQTTVQLPKGVKGLMEPWVLQMGFPVITVDTATGQITQEHFLQGPESKIAHSEFNYTWPVHVTSMKNGVRLTDVWLHGTSAIHEDFKLEAGSGDWILLNLNFTAFYRVNYDPGNWIRILHQLETDPSVIPIINRAQIINEAFTFARGELTNITAALETTRFLFKETHFLPWEVALKYMDVYRRKLEGCSAYEPMLKYLKKQAQPLFQHYKSITSNWTVLADTPTEQYNVLNAIKAACVYGVQECWELASKLYQKWMSNPSHNPIPTILRSPIYCSAIQVGGEDEWEFAWERLQNTGYPEEAYMLREAMSCSKEPGILKRYLNNLLNDSNIKKKDAASTIVQIALNPVGYGLVWDLVRTKWHTLLTKFKDVRGTFLVVVMAATHRFSSNAELEQLEQFKRDIEKDAVGYVDSGTWALHAPLTHTRDSIKWMEKNLEPMKRWFEAAV